MKSLNNEELHHINGGSFSFSGFGAHSRWGNYGRVSGGYTFKPTSNISVTPSVTVSKFLGEKPKITGGGINISIGF
ncbi:hypothetical protein [Avibacterium paragallinarum]|uniref:hypothetical protein n=1 Tax=Avibacterium paragallinarum TaxID=728 RepID=UPI0010290287|nr:hypothetical protein [Avibacterium paragallinarum]RZN55044.1 hypothetical protein EIG78_11560 [Avibacterium paragallinarum]